MTNEQKAVKLEEMAANREADSRGLHDLAEKLGLTELQKQKTATIAMADADAALLREAAGMMREREACPDGYYLYSKKDEKAGYNDGCILWWKPNGAGYTTNLHEAGVFTQEYKDKAQRKELVFVPCHLAWGSSFVARTAWRRSLKAAAVAWVDEQEGRNV